MVENSVGKLWLEQHPNAELEEKWTYYLKIKQYILSRKVQHRVTTARYYHIRPMYGKWSYFWFMHFDILMDIYGSQGYTKRLQVRLLTNNLYGLEIDDSISELAHFVIMMRKPDFMK